MLPRCHVRQLKIRTCEQALLPRIAFMMEDALRTASFPGIPSNGMVFIKHMNLGRIDSHVNSQFLSAKIDAFVKNQRPVRGGSKAAEQDDVSAVWFVDELEPYRILADHLAHGHFPHSWYWPLAVKGWSPHSPLSQKFQTIISEVAQKPSGITGLAYVLEPLLEKFRILDQLESMKQKDVASLLSFLGVAPILHFKHPDQYKPEKSDEEDLSNPYFILQKKYQDIIINSIARWGIQDTRLNLITCLGLADCRHEVTPCHTRRIIEKAVKKLMLSKQPLKQSVHSNQSESISNHLSPEYDSPKITSNCNTLETYYQLPPVQQVYNTDILLENTETNEISTQDVYKYETKDGDYSSEQTETFGGMETESFPGKKNIHKHVTNDEAAPIAQSHNEQPIWPEQMYLFHPFAGYSSDNSGFLFLINVLDKLGIEDIFSDFDQYPAFKIAQHILCRIAKWQSIADDDPVVQFLEKEWNSSPQDYICTPALNRQAIFDAVRDHVKPMFRIPESQDPQHPLNYNQVIHIFVIAVSRYIHQHAEMTIQKLIKRPAYIALTKTHLDITTSIKNIDVRIRMAGLDINPGWVPWLGRVIQFHYPNNE